jgi:hypothetical protein
VGLKALKSLNLTNGYPNNKNNKNNNKKKNNKVKSKPLELYELAGKNESKSRISADLLVLQDSKYCLLKDYVKCIFNKVCETILKNISGFIFFDNATFSACIAGCVLFLFVCGPKGLRLWNHN